MTNRRPATSSLVQAEHLEGSTASYPALAIEQNDQKFYFATIPKEDIFPYCYVADRREDPAKGFQRLLDASRAKDISNYLDESRGSIPTNIVLSAQTDSYFDMILKPKR